MTRRQNRKESEVFKFQVSGVRHQSANSCRRLRVAGTTKRLFSKLLILNYIAKVSISIKPVVFQAGGGADT